MITMFLIMALTIGFPQTLENFKWIFWERYGCHIWQYNWLSIRQDRVLCTYFDYWGGIFTKTVSVLSRWMPESQAKALIMIAFAINYAVLAMLIEQYIRAILRKRRHDQVKPACDNAEDESVIPTLQPVR